MNKFRIGRKECGTMFRYGTRCLVYFGNLIASPKFSHVTGDVAPHYPRLYLYHEHGFWCGFKSVKHPLSLGFSCLLIHLTALTLFQSFGSLQAIFLRRKDDIRQRLFRIGLFQWVCVLQRASGKATGYLYSRAWQVRQDG